jgi:hypothetical protein
MTGASKLALNRIRAGGYALSGCRKSTHIMSVNTKREVIFIGLIAMN